MSAARFPTALIACCLFLTGFLPACGEELPAHPHGIGEDQDADAAVAFEDGGEDWNEDGGMEPPHDAGDDEDAGAWVTPGEPDAGAQDEDAGLQDAGGGQEDEDAGTSPRLDMDPVLYPASQVRSPVSPSVVAAMQAIAAKSASRDDRNFIKVGDSHTVSTNFLHCLSTDSKVNLAGRDYLKTALEAFRGGSSESFSRTSQAALIGASASWVLKNDSSLGGVPLTLEISSQNPRFALVSYGTNDMQMASGTGTALFRNAVWGFYTNMAAILDTLSGQGIVPMVTGLLPRGDTAKFPDAPKWVPTYDAVSRGLAQARQIPWFDIYLATKGLPNQGLSTGDGVHGNSASMPCAFDGASLQYNANVRNLNTLEMLQAAYEALVLGEDAPDQEGLGHLEGAGTKSDPFVIESLPFTHHADTAKSPSSVIDTYSACGSQDESGREYFYRLKLAKATPVRLMVFSEGGADIDLQVMASSAEAGACKARADKYIESTWTAGTYFISLDSYAGKNGGYMFVALECEPDDADCK